MLKVKTLVACTMLTVIPAVAVNLDTSSTDSIKSAASSIASELVGMYPVNQSGQAIGILSPPGQTYYFWESGAFFDTLINYARLTGDSQYNNLVVQGLSAQKGDHHDYMPANVSGNEGNDDQSIWAQAAMSAAESQLQNPVNLTWVSLADNVFNEQAARWDAATCNGGLRWQIFSFNSGFDYKNTDSNGNFFNLASRLARYTGNSTYADWATKAFDWTTASGLIDEKWNVYDGAQNEGNCTEINKVQFSISASPFISGAANMYNMTSGSAQQTWKSSLDGLLNRTLTLFFPHGTAIEIACEPVNTCNTDMHAFKAILAQSLVNTVKLAPYTAAAIMPLLASTAEAAAKTCDPLCDFDWSNSTGANDGHMDVGPQMSALSFVQGLLVKDESAPTKEMTGTATSTAADPSATATTTSGTQSSKTSGVTGTSPSNDAVAKGLGLMDWIVLLGIGGLVLGMI